MPFASSPIRPPPPPPIPKTATDDTPGGHVHDCVPGTVNCRTYDRVPVCWNCSDTGARADPGSPDSSYTVPLAGDGATVTGGGTASSCDRYSCVYRRSAVPRFVTVTE